MLNISYVIEFFEFEILMNSSKSFWILTQFWPNSDLKGSNGSVPRRSNLSTQASTSSSTVGSKFCTVTVISEDTSSSTESSAGLALLRDWQRRCSAKKGMALAAGCTSQRYVASDGSPALVDEPTLPLEPTLSITNSSIRQNAHLQTARSRLDQNAN